MATGTATLDFTSTPSEEAVVTVTGQAAITVNSHVEAFFAGDTTADSTLQDHEEAAAICPLVCENIVAGVGFDIRAMPLAALGLNTFNIHWVWA